MKEHPKKMRGQKGGTHINLLQILEKKGSQSAYIFSIVLRFWSIFYVSFSHICSKMTIGTPKRVRGQNGGTHVNLVQIWEKTFSKCLSTNTKNLFQIAFFAVNWTLFEALKIFVKNFMKIRKLDFWIPLFAAKRHFFLKKRKIECFPPNRSQKSGSKK